MKNASKDSEQFTRRVHMQTMRADFRRPESSAVRRFAVLQVPQIGGLPREKVLQVRREPRTLGDESHLESEANRVHESLQSRADATATNLNGGGDIPSRLEISHGFDKSPVRLYGE